MGDLDRRHRQATQGPDPQPAQRNEGQRSRAQARYRDVQLASDPQAKGEPAPADAIQSAAQQGIAGSGSPLPFLDQIQSSFGSYDVSGVRAHVGGPAGAAAESMGAQGYATGNDVALRDASSLHTVAHEAAHVVQQRGGVQLKSGVGQVGDEYERNADAVADQVVRGESAEELLAPYAGGGTSSGGSDSATQRKPIQLYKQVEDKDWDRVSDDGRMAVSDHERDAWATPDLIARSNAALDQNKSKAKIETTSGPKKVNVDGRTQYWQKFRMDDRDASWSRRHFGDPETNLRDDCGGANQQMLGGEAVRDRSFVAATTSGGTAQEFTGKSAYHPDDNEPKGIVSTTEQMSGEIYVRIMKREFGKTLNRVDALAEWAALTDTQRDALSKKYSINKYAAPRMGQGVTIGSERDAPEAVPGGYNFHFALNLVQAGEDYIALEDFDHSEVKYYFKMYGPTSKGQSFAEEEDNRLAVGNKTTAMVVTNPHTLDGKTRSSVKLLDSKTLAPGVTLDKGTRVKIIQQGDSNILVAVQSGAHAGQQGWIPATAYSND